MEIEEGKSYRDRRGDVHGPMKIDPIEPIYKAYDEENNFWTENGNYYDFDQESPLDLVSEHKLNLQAVATEEKEVERRFYISPIKTSVVKEVIAGNYVDGRVKILNKSRVSDMIAIELDDTAKRYGMTSEEFRAAALLFNELADYLENEGLTEVG